jgi:hypothetical protein
MIDARPAKEQFPGQNKKPLILKGSTALNLVAGTGFEPVTFGL